MATSREQSRGFRVSARTILQLGGELISSDGIAFYELIKNAVDAGSKKVHVDVEMQLALDAIQELRSVAEESGDVGETDLRKLKAKVESAILEEAPDGDTLREAIAEADSLDELISVAADANSITFRDTGSGMTLNDLENIYLTVGTPHRLNERKAGSHRLILGEKGIGRLSAMRLGNHLHVTTSTGSRICAGTNWRLIGTNSDWTPISCSMRSKSRLIEVIGRKVPPRMERPFRSPTSTRHGR